MKIVMTGRQGQLVRSLQERSAGELLKVGRPEVDLAVSGQLAEAILSKKPDLVINAAAYTAVDQAEDERSLAQRVNAEAAGEAAQAAAEIGIPIIQISTDYVFDGEATSPITEDQPTLPVNYYGESKLSGEQAVRAANPNSIVLRTAWLISPFGRNFVKSMLSAAEERPEITVVADQHGSPTSALDLADAILHVARLLASGHGELLGRTFHVAGSGEASWYDVAVATMAAAEQLGLAVAQVVPIATSEWPTAAKRPLYSVLDSSAFAQATEFVMPDWRSSLSSIITRLAHDR